MRRNYGPLIVALAYAAFGAAWILLSDILAVRFLAEGSSMLLVQTIKGLFYVGLTTILVYGLVHYTTRQIREERSRYREMADNVGDLFYNYDPVNNRLLYAGRSFEKIWGRSLKEVFASPMGYIDGIHPDDQEAARDADRRQRAGESTVTEYRVVRPDGHVTWILDSSASIKGLDGKVERIVGSMRDITIVKEAQQALAASQRQLAALLDNLPGAAYRCRVGDRWIPLFVSEGIIPLTGYPPADFLNNARITYTDLIDPADRERVHRVITNATARRETFEVEYRIAHRDGSTKSVWERGRFFPETDGGEGILEGFILDITDRTRVEEERQRLEQRVRQSEKLEAIGQLAGGVAHDFNNLLTVILVRAEMALRKLKAGEPLHAGLKEIHDAAERCAGLARQLLTYAQRQPVKIRTLTLTDNIETALPMLRRLVGGDIRLAWNLPQGLWPIAITPTQVDQILVNLCLNARDAMPAGGKLRIETHNIRIDDEDCRTRPELRPGDHVVLSVADTGIGMNRQTRDRLFEPFFTTKEVGKGTGLGLATVHGIVRQCRGLIEVDSEPGKGSVFRMFFPRAITAHNPDDTIPPRTATPLTETSYTTPTTSRET